MKPTLLYIRGCPGSGKITTAKIVARELGWPLLWFHDFDFLRPAIGEALAADMVIGDAIHVVLNGLIKSGRNVVYVRPSRTPETVNRTRRLAEQHGCRFVLVGLTASYGTLCERVSSRPGTEYRISTRDGLDEYLSRPEFYEFDDQHTFDTTDIWPSKTAQKIIELVR